MKLSELMAKTDAGEIRESIYGVEVDVESFSPPDSLKEIGVLYRVDADNEMDVSLCDLIISYTLSGVKVVLELDMTVRDIDAKFIMAMAANMGISLAILPPENPQDEEAFIERVEQFASAYLRQANYAHEVFPVTSYLEYMFVEQLGSGENFQPTDDYILEAFVGKTSQELVHKMKYRLRNVILENFGGEEAFSFFAKEMFHAIYKKGANFFHESVIQ